MTESGSHPHELISAMIDGETDDRERAAVEAHLRDCSECRDLAADLAALGEVLGDEPVPPVPAGLASRIGWSLRARDASRRRIAGMRWPGPRMLTAFGGVAAAVVLAVLVVREGDAPFRSRPLPEGAAPRVSTDEPQTPAFLERREGAGTPPSVATGASGSGSAAPGRSPAEAKDTLDKMRALGYVAGGSAGGVGQGSGPGPSGTVLGGRLRQDVASAAPPAKPDAQETRSAYAPTPAQSALSEQDAAVSAERPQAPPPPASPLPAAPPASAPETRQKKTLDAGTSPTRDVHAAVAREGAVDEEGVIKQERAGHDQDDAAAKESATAAATAGAVGGVAAGVLGGEKDQYAAAPPPQDARAARGESGALAPAKSKVIANESLAKRAIPPCPGHEGAAGATRRWTATGAPLPLRAARSEAEADLAGLAARLGGSICVDGGSGPAALFVIDAPVARWSELREALAARAGAEIPLSAPPAEGYDLVRVVLRPK